MTCQRVKPGSLWIHVEVELFIHNIEKNNDNVFYTSLLFIFRIIHPISLNWLLILALVQWRYCFWGWYAWLRFVHTGHELYGSDRRTILWCLVISRDKQYLSCIIVYLSLMRCHKEVLKVPLSCSRFLLGSIRIKNIIISSNVP